MRVAKRKQRPADMNRDVERSAGHEFFIVQIAGVNPRRVTRNAAGEEGRCDTHAAEKGTDRNFYGAEARQHPAPVQWNDLDAFVWKVLRQKAYAGLEQVQRPGQDQVDRLDTHFEHISRLSPFDEDGSGEDVGPRTFIFHGAM